MEESVPKSSTSSSVPIGVKAALGGVSGIGAVVVTHPMDVIKNRMQLEEEGKKWQGKISTYQIIRGMLKKEGVLAMYAGLSAGILRQATYTTIRLGVYTWLFELFSGPNGESPTIMTKTAISMVAGLAGAFAGTPADVALIRMTSDGRLPPHQRRYYSNIFDALKRIRREEGITILWRGAVPTMGRAMIVNVAQLVTYSEAKERLIQRGQFSPQSIYLPITAGLVSGFATTVASMPVDLVKTRLQDMRGNEYSGSLDVLVKAVRKEGVFVLWRGFLPYFAKQAPFTILMFVFLEQLNMCYVRHILGIDRSSREAD